MTTLTLRLPDDTHARLKELARYRGVSLNKLMVELATIAVTRHDAEARFRVLAADGSADMGLDVLDKLDPALRGDAARRPIGQVRSKRIERGGDESVGRDDGGNHPGRRRARRCCSGRSSTNRDPVLR